jgi:hypothetical protein
MQSQRRIELRPIAQDNQKPGMQLLEIMFAACTIARADAAARSAW